MRIRAYVLMSALYAGTVNAGGQFVYYQVGANGTAQPIAPGQVDLSYPPPGTPTPIIDVSKGERNEGVVVSTSRGQSTLHVIISLQRQLQEPPPPSAAARGAATRGGAGDSGPFYVSEEKYPDAEHRRFIQDILVRMPAGSSAQHYAASIAAGKR